MQFSVVSKVIQDCDGFTKVCSMIGPEILRYPLNQSDANPKPIRTLFLAFFCTSGHLHVFILSPDWFLVIFSFSDWSSRLLWFWFHNTQLKSTLSNIAIKQVHRDFFPLVLDLVQFLLLCFLAFPIKMKTKKKRISFQRDICPKSEMPI